MPTRGYLSSAAATGSRRDQKPSANFASSVIISGDQGAGDGLGRAGHGLGTARDLGAMFLGRPLLRATLERLARCDRIHRACDRESA